MIASELVGKEAQLLSNQFGKYIAYKAALSVFKRSKDQWKVVIGQQDKKRKVAEDFLSDLDSSAKAKKQTSANQNKLSTNVDHHLSKKSRLEELAEYVIDRKGDESLKSDSVEKSEPEVVEKKKKKEKKKKAKSYLDDL